MIRRKYLKAEQVAGAEGPNFVLSGVKGAKGGSRGWYVHQGEVFGVLMAFLREEPTLPDSPLRLQHAGRALADIQGKVKAIYCNIPDEVIKTFSGT